jgi:hypothetical protein
MSRSKIIRGLAAIAVIVSIAGYAVAQLQIVQGDAPKFRPQQVAKQITNGGSNKAVDGKPAPLLPRSVNVTVTGKLDTLTTLTQHEWLSELFNAKITDYIIAAFTVFIAWFTWGLKEATIKLESATGKLVTGGDNNAERQLRAYCMVVKAEIIDVENGKDPRAKITIKNSGQTPAKNFKQVATMGYDTFPISRLGNPNLKRANVIEHPLPPQGYIDSYPNLGHILTDADIAALIKGDAAIYVVGEIHYDDAFGKNRTTTYKLFAGGPIGIGNGDMTAYDDGNDYT